jgi:outer membrane protein assembly factor BamB
MHIRKIGITISLLLVLAAFSPFATPVRADLDADYLGAGPGRFNSIKAMDIDDDGNIEIAFGNYDGYLTIIESRDGNYFEEWQSKSLGTRLWGLEIADCDSDGFYEILAGSGEGVIYAFNATSRELKWKIEGLGRDAHGIAVGNLDEDPNMELVVGTGFKTDHPNAMVFIFDGITRKLDGIVENITSRHRGVSIDDVDNDGTNELIFGDGISLGETAGEGYIYIYSFQDGELVREWKSEDLDGDAVALVTHDLDGDDIPEIIVGNGYRYNQGYCFIFKYLGQEGPRGRGDPPIYEEVWMSEDIGPKAYGLDVGDIDGDGIFEIVVGNQPGYIWIFDGSSYQVEWKSSLLGADILGIELSDVDQDGEIEIIASQGGYIGKADWTSAYTTPHIYIINGKTHEIEFKLGEPDYTEIALQAAVVLLIVITLVNLNWALRAKKRKRKIGVSSRRGIK